jgi:hypothetical protein
MVSLGILIYIILVVVCGTAVNIAIIIMVLGIFKAFVGVIWVSKI